MEITPNNTMSDNSMHANEMQLSSLLRLFGEDPNGKLQEARDKIYSYVWSRNRRDEGKLDWVLSQNGVNRNVPERFIEDTTYGSATVKPIHELPCGLILANKEISADFTRYIYSVNDLEVDVDLKATHTAETEAKLNRIITLLQNPNFVRYTRKVRVRIHFPDKYPFHALPAFNQRALEDIATTLDGFEQIEHLAVRIVSMQGPMEYELRLASFPFYPMSLTNWSIRLLNDTTLKWDIVGGEQLHQLNLAWDVYQATGSLTAQVNTGVTEETFVPVGQTSSKNGIGNLPDKHMTAQQKNGSQKRKARKIRGVSAAATGTRFTSRTPSSPDPAPPSADGQILSSSTKNSEGSTTSNSTSSTLEPSEARFAPEPPVASAIGTSKPPSPPLSPIGYLNKKSAVVLSASDTSGEVVMTPCESSVASPGKWVSTTDNTQTASKVENMDGLGDPTESKVPQTSCPPSPAPSSVTASQSPKDTAILSKAANVPDGASPLSDGLDSKEPPQKKKRRARKKPKKSKAANSPATPSESAEDEPAASGMQLNEDQSDNNISLVEARFNGNQVSLFKEPQRLPADDSTVLLNVTTDPGVPLSELADLEPSSFDGFCIGTKADGTKFILYRTREASLYLRQKERRMADRLEKEAEIMKARQKRQHKKVKEVLIRRRDPSHTLRRQIADTKQQKVKKQSSCSNKSVNKSGNDQTNALASSILALYDGGGLAIMTMPDTKRNPMEVPRELEDDDSYENGERLYTDLTSYEYEHAQSSQPAASPQFPAQLADNHRKRATAARSTKDNAFRFRGLESPISMEQGVQGLDAGYVGMDALNKGRYAYGTAALLSNVYGSDQDHREQRVIEEIDEPDDVSVLETHYSDDEGLIPRHDDGENVKQVLPYLSEMAPYDLPVV